MTHHQNGYAAHASAVTLCAESFELQGRLRDALRYASTEIADPMVINCLSRIRAGRVLGRAHAALGEHKLSHAAFDAAIYAKDCRRAKGESLLSFSTL